MPGVYSETELISLILNYDVLALSSPVAEVRGGKDLTCTVRQGPGGSCLDCSLHSPASPGHPNPSGFCVDSCSFYSESGATARVLKFKDFCAHTLMGLFLG